MIHDQINTIRNICRNNHTVGSTFASDDSPSPIVVKAPSPPAALPPIPYPNIGKGAEKPDSKPKENRKRVDKDFDRRGVLRFKEGSKYPERKWN